MYETLARRLVPLDYREGILATSKPLAHLAIIPLIMGLAWPVSSALAADEEADPRWRLCPLPPLNPELGLLEDAAEGEEVVHVRADSITSDADGRSRFLGDVQLRLGARLLRADEADYDQNEDRVELQGGVSLLDQNMQLSGSHAVLENRSDSAELYDAEFRVRSAHAFGRAGSIRILDRGHSLLSEVAYTTCPPGREDWLLSASEIELREEDNTGEAWHAVLRFKSVPFLYLPYVNFPLQGRKSGLLAPSLGSSLRSGDELALPIYWNIAPNMDATLTPHYYSLRGTMLENEFRYMSEHSYGELGYDHLEDDQELHANRYLGRISHRTDWESRWYTRLEYQEVSDPDYFVDLNKSVGQSSQTHLQRSALVGYTSAQWSVLGRVQDYQSLGGSLPYQRLPQLLLQAQTPHQWRYVELGVKAEAVHFAHDDIDLQGSRYRARPHLGLPLRGPGWFFQPAVALDATRYDLEGLPVGEESNPERDLVVQSLDTGLVLERSYAGGEDDYIHTIEPRLFWLDIPYNDQDTLPLFDTSLSGFSYASLFHDNRFVGGDRIGDTRQLTTALTTRLVSGRHGRDLLRLSVGQVHYLLDEQRVQLDGQSSDSRAKSPLIGELELRPLQGLRVFMSSAHDTEQERTLAGAFRLEYRPAERRLYRLGYQYDESLGQEHGEMTLVTPLSRHWRGVGHWYYDLELERSRESIIGLEYESCCWSLRVSGRNKPYQDSDGRWQDDRSYYLTLQLKGLTNIGRDLESLIDD